MNNENRGLHQKYIVLKKEYIERETAIRLANNYKDKTIDANDIARIPAVDPIHEMGGCYCWECEEENNGYCKKLRGTPTIQIGFCGYGYRKMDNEE